MTTVARDSQPETGVRRGGAESTSAHEENLNPETGERRGSAKLSSEDEDSESETDERRKGAESLSEYEENDDEGDEGAWSLDDNALYYKRRLYVPRNSSARAQILKTHHDDPHAGHFGQERTLELIQRKYYWPQMTKDVKEYVTSCTTCQRIKPTRHKPYGLLQPLEPPTGILEDVTMDFITDLPPSLLDERAYDSILVIVDKYTKLVRYIPVRKTITSEELADVVIRNWWKDFGLPKSVVSDRGSVFTAHFWSSLCYALKIKQRKSTAFHPQTDGQTERQNQTLEQYLRGYVAEQQNDWVKWLPTAEFAYNNSKHAATGISPFFATYGKHPRIEDEPDRENCSAPAALKRVDTLIEARKALEARWQKTVDTQAKYYNKKRMSRQYAVGELVWLSSKNVKTKRPSKKLDYKFLGPYRIEETIGTHAYRLNIKDSNIHPVFHVSLLEPYKRREDETNVQPAPLKDLSEDEWEAERILQKRVSRRKGTEYLVKWAGFDDVENTWEPAANIKHMVKLLNDFKEQEERRQRTCRTPQGQNRKRKW